MKVGFNVKYGYNEIDIPITDKTVPAFDKNNLTNLFSKKVTIYNDIPSDGVNPRRFDRFVIGKCSIQGGYVEKADGTIQTIANAKTVITTDIEHYKDPIEYAQLPQDVKDDFYTAQVDDFIVLGEVDDVVTTSREFEALQKKYSKNGFSITAVTPYIFGVGIDNISMTNV